MVIIINSEKKDNLSTRVEIREEVFEKLTTYEDNEDNTSTERRTKYQRARDKLCRTKFGKDSEWSGYQSGNTIGCT